MRQEFVDALTAASNAPGTSVAPAALVIARIEYPHIDADRYLVLLDGMGDAARRHIEREADGASTLDRIKAFNRYLFDEQHFVGNRERYEDPRNSCLNEVLDRRTGIPITMSLVYMEVA